MPHAAVVRPYGDRLHITQLAATEVLAMNVTDALKARSSVRAFRSEPVPSAVLERVFAAALCSPSWANTQPYRVALATGAQCDRLRRAMAEAARRRAPAGDHALLFDYPPELQARRRSTGFGLYAALGIDRHDHARREAQYRRNFLFFDAPAVAFLFAHEALGVYGALDAGVFLQSVMLAAAAEGVGTCAQAALASYPCVVREHFDVPGGYRLLCGLSLGYPADASENRFRPPRIALDELLLDAPDVGPAARRSA
jgi:nitroreductase